MKTPLCWLSLFFGCVLGLWSQPGWSTEDGEKIRTVMLELKGNKVDQETVNIVTSLVTAELSKFEQLELITSKDMQNMAKLEAEKQTMGCNDDSSCLVELAGALGARLVIFGDVGMLGPNIMMGLSLFDSQQAKAVSRVNVRTQDLGDPDKIEASMEGFIAPVLAASKNASAAKPAPKPAFAAVGSGGVDWLKVGGGLVTVAVGAGAMAWAGSQPYPALRAEYTAYQEAVSAAARPTIRSRPKITRP